MHNTTQLPVWLKSSKSNVAVIFDLQGYIADCNSLFSAIFINGNTNTITGYFSENEINSLWKRVHTLSLESNHTVPVIFNNNNSNTYQWEFSLLNKTHIIGIAQKQNTVTRKAASMINIDHLIDSFMNNSPASAWICDPDGRLVTMNRYFLSFSGLALTDIGKTLWELYPQQLADLYFRNNSIVLDTDKILKTEELSIDTTGRTRNFLVYKFPLKTIDNKKLVGGWAIDITERKVAEQKIFENDLKMKELAFLQSHEVRRPLANMLGLIELMKADSHQIENEHLKNILLYIQLSAKELDNEIKRVIDKLQEE
ncbi:hypothetical protein BH10BAC2_BH10BAC2_38750 [soil metagenome]